jgi:uncharacterized protein YkwD
MMKKSAVILMCLMCCGLMSGCLLLPDGLRLPGGAGDSAADGSRTEREKRAEEAPPNEGAETARAEGTAEPKTAEPAAADPARKSKSKPKAKREPEAKAKAETKAKAELALEEPGIREKLGRSGIDAERFMKYLQRNERERRLAEYADGPEELLAKLVMLDYINRSRSEYGRPQLDLDILASRTANKMSREAARHGFRGHWNLRGEKPYHRYALAGGTDHVSENAAAGWTSGRFPDTYEFALQQMKAAHDRFMAEKPPRDGHKQNVLDPHHNFVGLGYEIDGSQFRYYEEYIDRYLEVELEQQFLARGESTVLRFRPLREDHHPYALFVYYEPPLDEMTVAQVNRKGSYPDFSRSYAVKMWPWELPAPDAEGFIEVELAFDRRGSYYVDIYLDDEPYRRNTGAGTKGKIRGSGVVLFVP